MRKAARAEARKQRKEAAPSAPKAAGDEINKRAMPHPECPSLKTIGSQIARTSELTSAPKAIDQEIITEAGLNLERPSLKTTGSQDVESPAFTSVPKAMPTRKARTHFPAETVHLVYRMGGGKCTYVGADGNICGSTYTLQLDHIVPVALVERQSP